MTPDELATVIRMLMDLVEEVAELNQRVNALATVTGDRPRAQAERPDPPGP